MSKPDFDQWYSEREEELAEEYVNYILNSKARDIYDEIFYFEGTPDRILARAQKAKYAWELWLDGTFKEYCEAGEAEHDDMTNYETPFS